MKKDFFYRVFTCLLFCSQIQPVLAELTVVTEIAPPSQTFENNHIGGLATDLVREILNQAQLQANFQIYPWARSYKLALNNANTLIYSIGKTPERDQGFIWLLPVAKFELGFVKLAHRDDIMINSISDAKRYIVAAQRDDLATEYLELNGFDNQSHLIITTDISHSWKLLLSGKVDLIIDAKNALLGSAAKLSLPAQHIEYIYSIEELTTIGFLAANKQTDPAIISRLQQASEKVRSSALYQQKYFID